MNEEQVIDLVSDTLHIPPGKLNRRSKADEFVEWDSLGMLALISMLDGQGIQFDPSEATKLQSVEDLLSMFRKTGKLG